MHAPSPITKPARVASNGRDASVGSSSSATSPRIAQKPARIERGDRASVPPASTTSAWPRLIVAAPSPIAVEPVAQAETGAKFGPVRPSWIAIWPLAVSTSTDGMKNGETRSVPASIEAPAAARRSWRCRRSPSRRGSPTRAGSNSLEPGVVPGLLRGGDGESRTLRSIRRASLGGDQLRRVEAPHLGGDPHGILARVEASIQPIAARAPPPPHSQVDGASSPIGVTAPNPVMTTRRMRVGGSVVRLARMARRRRRRAERARERPAELDPAIPFPPMEAELVRELPDGDGWQYEPKWDGFRGLLENVAGELRLWSRNGRPLLRYFPELARSASCSRPAPRSTARS